MISFSYESIFPVSAEKLFAMHEIPDIFFQLLPEDNKIRVLRKDSSLEIGSEAHLILKFGPFQIPWIVKHTSYKKNEEFTDEQVKGPFKLWKHKHLFIPEGTSESKLKDEVIFSLPFSPFTHPLLKHFIVHKLKLQFQQRHKKLRKLIHSWK